MTKPHGLSANIRAEMARRSLTQADLASVLGISQSGVSARLIGKTGFSVAELSAVATWLSVPASSLLGEDVAA